MLSQRAILPTGQTISLEGNSFLLTHMDYSLVGKLPATINFWPTLYPLTLKGKIDTKLFGQAEQTSKVKMYTILMDGKPVRQDRKTAPKYKKGAKIELTDEFFGIEYLLSWEIGSHNAMTTRPILREVEVDELKRQNLFYKAYG